MIPIAQQIWASKYQYKAADGTPIDETPEDTFRRVALALATPEKDIAKWADEFFAVMKDFEFIPAGRILAGAGTDRSVTLSNCFTMGPIPDSIPGIFESLREAAMTMQQGGGIGYDFSTIRPKGALVKGVAAEASGPLSFMDCWDAMCRTIMSAGSRRGAMMATMRCDHPDILDFIEAKRDPAKLRMFNLSVLITDAFMKAVKDDAPWDLHFGGKVYEPVAARDLWDAIMRSTYAQAEPGVIFIDRINADHNIGYLETISTTNPCGEKPMGPYASCLLGSINLAKLIRRPFSITAALDLTRLREVVRVAVRMMDNVVDVGAFPLPQQAAKAKSDRQLGLGITGLADALLLLGMEYGTPKAAEWFEVVMDCLTTEAYNASCALAVEKGPFPTFNAEEFLRAPRFASRLTHGLVSRIRANGIRNSLLVSIAPTGTISLFAGNVSSGIEPIFAASYERKVLQKDGAKRTETVVDYATEMWHSLQHEGEVYQTTPPAYIDAQTLTPEAHLRMQAAAQKWVDSSISKTINLPKDISFDAFKQVYQMAYDMGCKGCTTYRPNDITGSVLSVAEAPYAASAQEGFKKAIDRAVVETAGTQPESPAPRPAMLQGRTYKVKLGDAAAVYVTINDNDGKPWELFLSGKDVTHQAWMAALSRMISGVFRRGGDVSFVAEELRAIHDPVGGGWADGRRVPSLPAAIGDVIARHLARETGEDVKWPEEALEKFRQAPLPATQINKIKAGPLPWSSQFGVLCEKCYSHNVKHEAGCLTCADCGHSKCG